VNKAFSVGLVGVYCMARMGFSITDCICSTPLLCSQYSMGKGTVNVVLSVMMVESLHLTPFWFDNKFFGFEMGRGYRNHQVVDKIPRATKSKTANFCHTV